MHRRQLNFILLLTTYVIAITSDYAEGIGDIDGPVVDDGGTGKGDTEMNKQQEEKIEQKAAETAGLHSEAIIQAQQDAYDAWMEACVESSEMPEMDELVNQFLVTNGMNEEDLYNECEQNRGQTSDGNHGRRMIHPKAGIWDKCLIPYKFDANLPDNQREAVQLVHATFEKQTGFRFVEYNNTNSQMGLGHNNYLNYIDGNGCWSFVGNLRNRVGQNISPCGGFPVGVHEVGHALGARHEHQDPATYSLMKPNFDNMDPEDYPTYIIKTYKDVYNQEHFYDLTSAMSYGTGNNRFGYGKMLTTDEPELTALIGEDDYFYMFRDLQEYHNCYAEYSSCDTLPVCQRGGYPSVVNGVCACACPEGLDPATSCATVMAAQQLSGAWPAGTYTLLRVTNSACPTGTSAGQMTRWNFKATFKGGDYHSEGFKNSIEYTHDVCTQTASSGSGEWPAGSYCLLKRGDCPNGFEEGLIETYGRAPVGTDYATGALPDGKKGQDFEYRFCCRMDGYWKVPISVPNTEPFIWYAKDKKGCQQVNGMHVFRENYHTKSDNTNRNLIFNGSLPHHYAWNTGAFRTYYCVYFPITTDGTCSAVKTFSPGDSTYTFSSPDYPNNYPLNSGCMWHFESPIGTTMRIDFTDFEVSTIDDPFCKSFVELKTLQPGMTGYRICGHHQKKSRLSVENYLTVKFASSVYSQQKGFTATVTMLSESDQCFTGAGTDMTYAGNVDYSQNMKACLPWSQVTNCALNQFSYSAQNIDLTHNYCRAVETGRMPWCYVNAELCYRENCDACMRDACYDVLPNCADIVLEDDQFCTNDDQGEARRGCRDTCGFCSSHTQLAAYTTVTCPPPGDVTGISPVPSKATYGVGEVVDYTCPSSSTIRTRTCRGDGTWTHLGYVCSGCPTGWSYVLGRCYQWQGPEVKLNYNGAKAVCENLGSTLAVVESEEQLKGVLGLTNYDRLANPSIWFALRYTNGAWAWEDGTPVTYTGWKTGQPSNTKCVRGAVDGTWQSVNCGYKFDVVCTQKPTGTFECEDDLPNCEEVLQTTPDLCEVHSDYAWVNCRKTCSVAGCPANMNICSSPDVEDAQQTHGTEDLNPGQYVEHQCDDGFLHTAGDLKRTCLSSGQFNGAPLVCSDPQDVSSFTLFSDVELFRRDSYSDMNFPVVADIDSTRITVAGKITAWTFFSSEAGEISMLLWRPNPSNAAEFTLIGKNTLTVTADNRAVTMNISAGDQIPALVGDVIGLHMTTPVITFSKCKPVALPQFATWRKGTSTATSSSLTVTQAYTFKPSAQTCRVYSIRVTIAPLAD